MVSLRDILS